MRSKRVYEISLTYQRGQGVRKNELFDLLSACGVPRSEIVEYEDRTRRRFSFFSFSSRAAQALKKRLFRFKIEGISVTVNALRDCEWKTRWKEEYRPFYLNQDIRIVPVRYARSLSKKKAKEIIIDTDTVFGTGTHPTTRAVAGFLREKKDLIASFLDIGTGTGILALAAAAYGIERVYINDISREALATAKKNFLRNKRACPHAVPGNFRTMRKPGLFDFVAANVITDELIAMRRKIISCVRPGKYLAVSGISLVNYKRFRDCFDSKELRCLRIHKKEGWCALLYKRKKD